jgi:hypothetical protein
MEPVRLIAQEVFATVIVLSCKKQVENGNLANTMAGFPFFFAQQLVRNTTAAACAKYGIAATAISIALAGITAYAANRAITGFRLGRTVTGNGTAAIRVETRVELGVAGAIEGFARRAAFQALHVRQGRFAQV